MDLRVASNFASFSTSGAQAVGCPTALHFQLCLSMSRQVAPASASSGLAGDGSSSRLEFRILQRIQRLSSELPRSFAPLVAPVDESPGCPVPASSGCAGDRHSSCPESRVLQRFWCWRFGFPLGTALPSALPGVGCEFPRTLHLPALPRVKVFRLPRILFPLAPTDGSPSCLGSRILRLCRPCVFGLPRVLHLRLGQ